MAESSISEELEYNIVEINEGKALSIVKHLLEEGQDPLEIIRICQNGMKRVGERYERREYFISGLIMAGELFRQTMEMIQPYINEKKDENPLGSILIGTVAGDIHDLGKDMFSELVSCHGFRIHDLGVDVPSVTFRNVAMEKSPDIIGMSILITSAMDSMKEAVTLLKKDSPSHISKIPIVIGGSLVDEEVCLYTGADYWVNDAMNGVRVCQKMLMGK